MDRIGDALDLFFKSCVQMTQRSYAVLKSSMRHFIRREAFRKEAGAGPQEFFSLLSVLGLRIQFLKNLVVDGSKFYEALLLRDCLAPEVISQPECLFTP